MPHKYQYITLFYKKRKANWKSEYDDTIYKIYDWNDNLAGYFYPSYNIKGKSEIEQEEIMVKMNEDKDMVKGGQLMVPFLKLNLLDTDYLNIDETISNLQSSVRRAISWKNWLEENKERFNLSRILICTSREDRNLLAILLEIQREIKLEEKEVILEITPILDQLNRDKLL